MLPAHAICVSPQQQTLQACWKEAHNALGRRMLFGRQNEFRISSSLGEVTGQVRLATLINRVMVQGWGQGAMMAAARLAPRLISDIADLTAHTRSN